MSGLLALGVSHRTASLALREQLALTEGRAAGVLNGLVSEETISEGVALSTCNRTELYLVATDSVEAEAAGLGVWPRKRGSAPRSCWARSTRCAAPRPHAISTG